MTDNINTYTFDFETEVSALLREIDPQAAERVLFFDVDITPDRVDIQRIMGNSRLQMAAKAWGVHKRLEDHYMDDPDNLMSSSHNSSSSADISPEGSDVVYYAVFMRREEEHTQMFGENNRDFMKLRYFYHETAHALIPDDPAYDDEHPFREAVADADAALRLFQRFGEEAAAPLSLVSWHRSFNALCGDVQHLTTTVLDRIILDSQRQDFSQLTHDEVLAKVQDYARECLPGSPVIDSARALFEKADKSSATDLLATTCLSSAANDFAFYVSAKAAQPFIGRDEIIFNNQVWQSTDEALLERVREGVESRAANMNLQNIFKTATEPLPLSETLKISLPKGQKRFNYSP